MKSIARISTVTTLAAALMLGAGAGGAMAEDAPVPPVQQQSNMTPTADMLTEEVFFKGPSEGRRDMNQSESYPRTVSNPLGGRPMPASAPIAAGDGSRWILVQTENGSQARGWRYVSEDAILSSHPAGTFDAAAKIAAAAAQVVSDAHFEQFSGRGTVKAGAGWYANEDTTTSPLAVASDLGFESELSEPYESDGQQWRKISLYADGAYTTAYVLAADVINYQPSEPTKEATITASEEAPEEMPSAQEGVKAANSNEKGNDQPENLGLMIGGGLLVVAAGSYLYWTKRKSASDETPTGGEQPTEG